MKKRLKEVGLCIKFEDYLITRPSLLTIMLSGCRSPMPRIKVATQKPAHDLVK
jgi:hypothetical protein